MTSQLNVDTIVDKAGSGGTNVKVGNTSTYVSDGGAVAQNTVQGLAKCWTLWDAASTPAHRDSFNAGSITDHGTGEQTIAFTNIMVTANFTTSGQAGGGNNSDSSNAQIRRAASTSADQRCTICYASGGTTNFYDYGFCSLLIHGDLA